MTVLVQMNKYVNKQLYRSKNKYINSKMVLNSINICMNMYKYM